ncbi:plant invertase/pectin methylesterase inhibitor [Striga asiatica]|uniref:Plant invertase/pectin methylesterase inhibitor n=1 Tax=Striga asiatica TaxID=4170 RepID=A0A5A7PWD5_STRAF|nr:plant invertase/pectin methylesterase inhibitor [Striga asiatica]
MKGTTTLLILATFSSLSLVSYSRVGDLITSICSQGPPLNEALCECTLSSANCGNPNDTSKAAFTCMGRFANKAAINATTQLRTVAKSLTNARLAKLCVGHVKDAIDQLKGCTNKIWKTNIDIINSKCSAAETDIDNCIDDYNDLDQSIPEVLQNSIGKAKDLITIMLAITNTTSHI